MGLRLVSGGEDVGRAAEEDRRGPDLPGPAVRLPAALARGGGSLAGFAPALLIAGVLVLQATIVASVAGSSRWWAVLTGLGTALVCAAAFDLHRRQAAGAQQEQASRVYVATERTRNEDGSLMVVARVYNASDQPIWHVELKPRREGAAYESALLQLLPDVLPAGCEEWRWRVESDDAPYEERYPEVIFLDSGKRRWRRVGPRLERVAAPGLTG